ncbi:hypothetical protein RA307_12955 [Xanthobacteraceae bacterium Astr-EGSB]|uniref:hypothetical protein n=1 Tax=Astrobacterium formosum TaxID=3069710 RepID=UPI0027B3B59A|nr:hypothetical protein [Xanthobacteraceae bacterium Astr-EGSB]
MLKTLLAASAFGLFVSTGTAPALAQAPSKPATPQTGTSSATSGQTAAQKAADQPDYSKAMRRLLEAADHLRDATHAMAEQKAGAARNDAIRQTNEALLETQRAMVDLPAELRNASSDTADRDKAMDKLKQATQKLREAVQAMAAQPAGPGRNTAIRTAHTALLETQQAMIDLIPDTDTATTGKGR